MEAKGKGNLITRKTMSNLVNRLEREGYQIHNFSFLKTGKEVKVIIEGETMASLFDKASPK